MKRRTILALMIVMLLTGVAPVSAQGPDASGKPFIMPVAGAPGPSTWILGQPYGNTTGAFVSGARQYSAGQYLHFGVDISMACGTPVIAVADGVIGSVDTRIAAQPHNLAVGWPLSRCMVTCWAPPLVEDRLRDRVMWLRFRRPDETRGSRTCTWKCARPIRRLQPILYIEAPHPDWDGLACARSFSAT